MEVPADTRAYLAVERDGPMWCDRAPALARAVAADLGLTLGAVLPGGMVSLVVEATTADGADAVLKVQFPHREAEHEAAALRVWDGAGAARLLAHDAERHALVVERCRPGRRLSQVLTGDAALDVVVDLLPQLWKPAGAPFTPLAEEVQGWIETLARDRATLCYDPRYADLAIALLRELSDSQGESVLVHQDLHGDNVLSAQRAPWLAIDPKPVVGEREFSAAPIIRSFELGPECADLFRRLDRVAELGLDRDRCRLWTIAQTIAWANSSSVVDRHLQTVRWLLGED